MITAITHTSIPVPDHDTALAYYTNVLGFDPHSDTRLADGGRWLSVCPHGNHTQEIVLWRISEWQKFQEARQGAQGAVPPMHCLETDDCRAEVERLRARDVRIVMEPNEAMWGTQAVFEDAWGNAFCLVEPPVRPGQGGG